MESKIFDLGQGRWTLTEKLILDRDGAFVTSHWKNLP